MNRRGFLAALGLAPVAAVMPASKSFADRPLGIMGEVGPEAIMPLRRGSDGRLSDPRDAQIWGTEIEQVLKMNSDTVQQMIDRRIEAREARKIRRRT